ncbi:KEOPS complex subunit Pcc1 [Methanohalophilus profundi]|uniref:KEOPS complex subunit Pcc1 n=1 Tax=Methanohalophilus profundi TaxID=2138083 RepID=UPI00101BA3B4|nr:KEOPS complex subunit Pcc1 [Methanohalophilus profundi]
MDSSSETIIETPDALKLYLSVKPELDRLVTDRSSIEIDVKDSQLVMRVTSDDLISMRSTLNTWYRLIKVAYEMVTLTSPN